MLKPTGNIGTSPTSVLEKVFLCTSTCGGVNLIAFLWGCIVHLTMGLRGKAFIFPSLSLSVFSWGLEETPYLVEAFSNAAEEVKSVFYLRCLLLLSLLLSLSTESNPSTRRQHTHCAVSLLTLFSLSFLLTASSSLLENLFNKQNQPLNDRLSFQGHFTFSKGLCEWGHGLILRNASLMVQL